MRRITAIGLALLCNTAALASPTPANAPQTVAQATALIKEHKSAQALALLEPLIAQFDPQIADAEAKGMVFCAASAMESLLYSSMAAGAKKSGTVFSADLCTTLFLKGFALAELERKTEAVAALERLTQLAPMHAHYFVELGAAYRADGQLDAAHKAYQQAIDNIQWAEDQTSAGFTRAAARRGIGYVLIEKGDLAGAEAAYRESLKDDPDSPVAKSELAYIAAKRTP